MVGSSRAGRVVRVPRLCDDPLRFMVRKGSGARLISAGLRLKPDRCETMTHQNKRYLTTTLFAALDVLRGTSGPKRQPGLVVDVTPSSAFWPNASESWRRPHWSGSNRMTVVAIRRTMLTVATPGACGVTMRRSRVRHVALITVSLVAAVLLFYSGGPGAFVQTAQAQSRVGALIDRLFGRGLPAGIAKTNGRVEATQVDVAPKYAGRLSEVSVEEGDTVTAGQVVARVSAPEFEAQLRGAQSEVLRAQQAKAQAEALIAQRNSDVQLAAVELHRTEELVKNGHATRQSLDQRRSTHTAAMASLRAAVAQREQANFAMHTAEAEVERLKSVLADLVLHAPRAGRVLYKLRRAGEVVSAGTPVLTILDLRDVYMTIFLPAAEAGRLKLGDEARVVLDPMPQYVIPATVSFVAPEAQFTPKTVETREEREKLVFRVKLQIDPDVLKTHEGVVKAGVRGMGFVRTVSSVQWPDKLQVKLPQ